MSIYEDIVVQGIPSNRSEKDLSGRVYAVDAAADSSDAYTEIRRPAHTGLANFDPAPFGLVCYASTNMLLSLTSISARGVSLPNIIVGQAFALGGGGQILAGIFSALIGRTADFATFTSFGSFWISFAIILLPSSGVQAAYEGTGQYNNALGLFFAVWTWITFLYLIASFRSNFCLVALLFGLFMSYLFATISQFTGNASFSVAGGSFGIFSAIFGYYLALGGLWRADTHVNLPVGDLSMKRV